MRSTKYMLALGLATALTACAMEPSAYYTQTHYTNPTYTIVQGEGNIETRNYQSLLVAEITENGDRETAMKNGYEALNSYFQGANSTGEKIAMTEPVMQFAVFHSIHGMTDARTVDNHKWVVRFFLPVEFTRASAPQPQDQNVRILETNPMKVVAISYSGRWSNENIQSNEDTLKEYINNNALHAVDVPAYAFYDSPASSPWSRHNEVLIKLSDE